MNDGNEPPADSEITRILSRIQDGEGGAAAELWPLVYDKLRNLANFRVRSEFRDALKPTELVHEAYLRLVDVEKVQYWTSRGHFFAAAAEAMRRILVDEARARGAIKRGGQLNRVNLEEELRGIDDRLDLVLQIDDALTQLENHDAASATLVKLRFFGGMSHQEAATAMGLTRRIADRHWVVARTWLFRLLSDDDRPSSATGSDG